MCSHDNAYAGPLPGDYAATCLYCGRVTGYVPYERKTVCGDCVYSGKRDEAREIAAGMTPWVRPLSFWVTFFGMTPVMTDLMRREG